jgi:hypothetical protein
LASNENEQFQPIEFSEFVAILRAFKTIFLRRWANFDIEGEREENRESWEEERRQNGRKIMRKINKIDEFYRFGQCISALQRNERNVRMVETQLG